jgi:hypothetical protein
MLVLLPTRSIQLSGKMIPFQSGRPSHSTGGRRVKNVVGNEQNVKKKISIILFLDILSDLLSKKHIGLLTVSVLEMS